MIIKVRSRWCRLRFRFPHLTSVPAPLHTRLKSHDERIPTQALPCACIRPFHPSSSQFSAQWVGSHLLARSHFTIMSALSGRLARGGPSRRAWDVLTRPTPSTQRLLSSSRSPIPSRLTTHPMLRSSRPHITVVIQRTGNRTMHVRALSFSSLGKAALRGLRLPVFAGTAALGTAAGTMALANRTADRE